jgi:predicted RNA-binding Zn-ribbon protein involved in translation (DUF1610 family)
MMIMATFCGFECPECGEMIMASEIKGIDEPSLTVTMCGSCGAELQVRTDPGTGDIKTEKLKKS